MRIVYEFYGSEGQCLCEYALNELTERGRIGACDLFREKVRL